MLQKARLSPCLPLAAAVAIVLASMTVVEFVFMPHAPAENPDPNHTHADFVVWVDGARLEFAKPEFMSGLSTDTNHDQEVGDRKMLHLHDGNGSVIHRHKPGLTLGQFFQTLGTTFRMEGAILCIDFPQISEVCADGAAHGDWMMEVSGKMRALDMAYVFADTDKILIFNTPNGQDAATLAARYAPSVTDDACKYSRTCPWKGDPPAENCIADPTVPCLVE